MHTWSRRLLLPWFSHRRVAKYETVTRELCRRLADGIVDTGRGDAAVDYAQQIPARVIAGVLGVPADMADTFTGWVRDVLEFAHDDGAAPTAAASASSPTSPSRSRTAGRTPATTSSATCCTPRSTASPSPTPTCSARPRSR